MEAEYEYGFERFMHKDNVGSLTRSEYTRFAPALATELESLESASSGVISALTILQAGYNEMKEHLDLAGPSTGLLPPTSIISDINSSMGNIKKFWKFGDDFEKTDSDVSGDETPPPPASIGSRRVQLKNSGWGKVNTSSKLISKAMSDSTEITSPFVTMPALRVYSAKEKRDEIQELRRRTVVRQLTVPE